MSGGKRWTGSTKKIQRDRKHVEINEWSWKSQETRLTSLNSPFAVFRPGVQRKIWQLIINHSPKAGAWFSCLTNALTTRTDSGAMSLILTLRH